MKFFKDSAYQLKCSSKSVAFFADIFRKIEGERFRDCRPTFATDSSEKSLLMQRYRLQ